MVTIHDTEGENGINSKTLGDWVKNFRLKKIQMKRKLRSSSGNLRVCAILTTALMTAELELRRKQQERFQKWLDFQTKINKNYELQSEKELSRHLPIQRHRKSQDELAQHNQVDEESCKQSDEITNLWKCELSELDNFMRSISSSASKNNDSKECDSYQKDFQTRSIRVSS